MTPLPPQLLAYIGGPGGTGKSQIIKAVQSLFSRAKRKEWLRTSAYTGSAASNVNGSTVSSIMKDSKNDRKSLVVSLKNLDKLVRQVGKMKFFSPC